MTRDTAARALACLDLTNLDERASLDEIDALCARARTPHGPVAAVCIYPRFAEQRPRGP
jgi:deoxyribose-phosphate aldolase